jgi:hypothetical protein
MKLEESYRHLISKAKEFTGLDITYTRNRRFEIVMIKACVINILYRYFGANTVQTAKLFDIHHSTVIHHHRAHPNRYKQEVEYAELYNYLTRHATLDEKSPINVDEMVEIMRRTMSV